MKQVKVTEQDGRLVLATTWAGAIYRFFMALILTGLLAVAGALAIVTVLALVTPAVRMDRFFWFWGISFLVIGLPLLGGEVLRIWGVMTSGGVTVLDRSSDRITRNGWLIGAPSRIDEVRIRHRVAWISPIAFDYYQPVLVGSGRAIRLDYSSSEADINELAKQVSRYLGRIVT